VVVISVRPSVHARSADRVALSAPKSTDRRGNRLQGYN